MIVRLCVLGVLLGFNSVSQAQQDAPKLETVTQKASFQIGMNVGANLRRQGLPLDPKIVAQGLIAGLKGQKSPLSEQEIKEVFAAIDVEMRKLQQSKAAKNLKAGQEFLAANKTKPGVKVTKSGLQYIVVKQGDGAVPTTKDTVVAHYRGTLIDGTLFDGSYRGDQPTASDEPISFGVTQVIKGWTEGLQLMKVGSHYRMFIPGDLAYGPNGPGEIGPNSVLIFEIYLQGLK
jgi:FKBP-type peptidyl-prolyl cis-trans isomerase